MTKNFFFSTLSFIAVFGSGIRDLESGMGKNQDPGSGINILDPQHWYFVPILRNPLWSKLTVNSSMSFFVLCRYCYRYVGEMGGPWLRW
jgi:hypothetical protein